MAGCQIDVLPGDISDIILKKKVSYKTAYKYGGMNEKSLISCFFRAKI